MRKGSRLGIQEMAKLLEMRKKNQQHTVLLLGARAGQLFRSTLFYENLGPVSKRNFHQLSRIKQFQECYSILTNDNKFSERDLHSILQTSLNNLPVIDADLSLASFIRNQYFDEIISTNIDDVIEDALAQTEMKEGHAYEILSIGRELPRDEKSCFCRITKVFGDFVSREYTVRERPSRLENPELKNFLQKLLQKDLLIVGIDRVWDQDILRIIPIIPNGSMWLVSEDEDIINKSSDLTGLLHKRPSACILGREGSYDSFMPKVHHYLHGSSFSSTYQHHIAKRVDLLPSIEEKLTSLLTMQHTMSEQLAYLTTTLSDIKEQMQLLQNKDQTLFSENFHEIQRIQQKSEEFRGD